MDDRQTLEECVRQCVREELRRSSSAQGQQSSLIQRTRQLISTSATALSRDLVGRAPSNSSPRSESDLVRPIATATSNKFNSLVVH